MIEVMQAFEDGKKIQQSPDYNPDLWEPFAGSWDWKHFMFRIAPEPKKEGRWERVEIVKQGNAYFLTGDDSYRIDALPSYRIDVLSSIPGFGGIDYRSPFDESVVVRSMVPVMFKSGAQNYVTSGDFYDEEIMIFENSDRPGIPVAAWFWKEGEK